MKITSINSHKFKTNLCSIFLAVPLIKENVTKNALIPCVLKRGTKDLPNQLEISKKLEEMYYDGELSIQLYQAMKKKIRETTDNKISTLDFNENEISASHIK
jgi:hypothetical protein